MFEFKRSKPPFRQKILTLAVRIERAYDAVWVTLGRSLGFWTHAGARSDRGRIKPALSICIDDVIDLIANVSTE